jgi:uncharacterized small protein (DUF1192 family)
LNHLDRLSLERIEEIENKISDLRDFDRLETELEKTHASIAML